jgi:hypothetical protein
MARGSGIAAAALVAAVVVASDGLGARADLPARLSDTEFWALIESTSEPNGYFRSDNIVSDEAIFAQVVPDLLQRRRSDGVYLGVGPEQNFTYIAALEPPMAFIIDIRRGNLHLHLLYKALFELSADRAEFISRLFVKPRPAGLGRTASADAIIKAYWPINTAEKSTYRQRVAEVRDVLVTRHRLPLSDDDLRGIEYVYQAFYWFGPMINWESSTARSISASSRPSVADLLRQVDVSGRELSFLANVERFAFVKALQEKNLVVPVVGNFAGSRAVQAVGQYLREHSAQVGAFYVSEVEAYLVQDGLWPHFCRNLSTLPRHERSVLIRPSLTGFGWPGPTIGVSPSLFATYSSKEAQLVPIAADVAACAGRASAPDESGDPRRPVR